MKRWVTELKISSNKTSLDGRLTLNTNKQYSTYKTVKLLKDSMMRQKIFCCNEKTVFVSKKIVYFVSKV